MRAQQLLTDLARRPLEAARALRPQLDAELLTAHPHHDNSISWLLWHSAREIDEQVAAIAQEPSVWLSAGFEPRFGLDLPPHELGYGHTPEQARSIRVTDADLLMEYLEAAVEAQVAVIESLDDEALDEVIDESWEPPVTRASRLISISVDAAEHIGQAAYVAGMGRAAFEESR